MTDRVRILAPLQYCALGERADIEVDSRLSIRHLTDDEQSEIHEARGSGRLYPIERLETALELREIERDRSPHGDGWWRAIDTEVLCLRLSGSGEVACDMFIAHTSDGPRLYGKRHYVVWTRPHHSHPYAFTEWALERYRKLRAYGAENLSPTLPAFRYFFNAYHEPYAIDRFVATMIGLEASLLGT